MSTVAQVIPVLPREPKTLSALHWIRSHAWGLFDQVLISATNFITMWLAGRSMGLNSVEFGAFTLVYSAMLFANILQSTLVTQPHNVLAANRKGREYARYTTATAVSQLLMVVVLAALSLGVAGFAHLRAWTLTPLLIALVPSIVAWQLQEFVRRVLYTEGRLGAAFANDVLSYGGQALYVAWLFHAGTVSGPGFLYALAITSMAGAVMGLWQLRHSLSRHFNLSVLRENWHFGKWIAGAEILGWCSSLHMYLYIAAIILGISASGELKGVQIIFGPTRVFAFFLGTVLPIRFARTHHAGGNRALHQQFRAAAWLIAPMLGLYCLVVAIFGKVLLQALFTNVFPGGGLLLALFSLSAFLNYLEMFVLAALTATRRTRYIFLGSFWASVIAICLSWPIIALLGVHGAVVCLILSHVIINIMLWSVYGREIAHAPDETSSDDKAEDRSAAAIPAAPEILHRLVEVLNQNDVPYCLLHGYRNYSQRITGDVDCLIPESALAHLPKLLHEHRAQIGADVAQWLSDASPFIVLHRREESGGPGWLQLHPSSRFSINNLLFYRAEEILLSRRNHNGFFVPAPRIEFACILINRIIKRSLKPDHRVTLEQLYRQDPDGCAAEIRRFWSERDANQIIGCIEQFDFEALEDQIQRLRTALLVRRIARQPLSAAGSAMRNLLRRIGRFLRPRFGLHVVFLGPDGVGKSTIIEQVSHDITPAFMRQSYQTFAALLPGRLQPKKKLPHELPARSYPASLVKAAWWATCYCPGYLFNVHLTRARAGLVLCHRYLLDVIVDRKRYRYSGPQWLLHAVWRIAIKPDLIILLDAPAEVIQQRKREVAFEETARQRDAYRALVEPLSYARIIDASRPVEQVVADVDQIIADLLKQRVCKRFGHKEPS